MKDIRKAIRYMVKAHDCLTVLASEPSGPTSPTASERIDAPLRALIEQSIAELAKLKAYRATRGTS